MRGRVLISSPSSSTLSIRRVEPTRAATASVGPSRSATATYSGSIPASARIARARVGVVRRERARDRERAPALLGREPAVARREREPVGVADGRDDADLELEVQVADELLDDRDLLGVLAAEVRDVGPDDREELQADGRDAAEVAGPCLALEPDRSALGLDPGREPGRIELLGRRREEEVDTRGLGRALVGGEVARVGGEVARVAELRRVDEEARDDDVALGARGREERAVAVVERAHRRHEADRRARSQRAECMPQLCDRA